MNKVSFTLANLNEFLEVEKRKGNNLGQRSVIKGFTDLQEMSPKMFKAGKKILDNSMQIMGITTVPNSFEAFAAATEKGYICIGNLSSRQKMLFVAVMNRECVVHKMMDALVSVEITKHTISQILPAVALVLDNPDIFKTKVIKEAEILAAKYLELSLQERNYREYLAFVQYKSVSNGTI